MFGKSRFIALVLLLGIGAVQACSAAQTNEGQAEKQLNEGIKLFSERRFNEAVAAFSGFKQASPQDPRPYFYAGMALAEVGRLSAAALELSEAVRLDPQRPEYLIFQADVLSRLKQKSHAARALASLEKEATTHQLETSWLWLLSDVYYRLEKFDGALRTLDLLGKRKPEDSRVDLYRGQVHLVKGDLDLARDSLNKSIDKSANNPLAYYELGRILQLRDELSAAKKALLEAVRQDGSNPEYLHRLGSICLDLNEPEEAIKYLKRAEPSAATLPEIYYALGNAYQRRGDPARAREYREKYQEATSAAREKKERDLEVGRLIEQGEEKLDQGRQTDARALFEQALRADPGSWDAHGYLAEMFLSAGDWQLAHEHLVKMEQLDPDSVVGSYLMAKYWYQRGELERARGYAEKVKLVRPAHAELRRLLGDIYLGLDQGENALREYRAAVRLNPNHPDYREKLQRVEELILQKSDKPQKK